MVRKPPLREGSTITIVNPRGSTAKNSKILGLLLCIAAPIVAFAVIQPSLEMGFGDDWGFYHMALVLARTGGISYENWTTPMSLPHVFWGAALIRLFGFSFFLLRLGMLPFWAGCGALLYLLGNRIGLPPSFSALASLAVTLSPIVTPLGASYHSDVTALVFVLLALYCGMRAVAAPSSRPAAWMLGMGVSGALAGMTRDVYWLIPVCTGFGVVLLLWRERRLRILGIALLGIISAAAAVSNRWHYAQPHAPAQGSLWKTKLHAGSFAETVLYIALTVALECLPLLLSLVRRISALQIRSGMIVLTLLGAIVGVALRWEPRLFFPPWIGNMFTEYGSFYNHQFVIGYRQVILQAPVRFILGCLVLGGFTLSVGAAVQVAGQYRGRLRAAFDQRDPFLSFIVLAGPLTAGYVVLLALRSPLFLGYSGYNNLFDRYLVPVAAIAALIAGSIAFRLRAGKPGLAAGAALAVAACFAVANVHDLYAEHRAVLGGAQWTTDHGVARHLVSGGYEYDGWTQLEEKGLASGGERGITDPNAQTVARKLPVMIWFQYATDAVTPCYYVVASPQAILSTVHEVEYRAWLPPATRRVLVQRSTGEFAAARDCPLPPQAAARTIMSR